MMKRWVKPVTADIHRNSCQNTRSRSLGVSSDSSSSSNTASSSSRSSSPASPLVTSPSSVTSSSSSSSAPRLSRADEFYGLSGMEGTVHDEFGDTTADLRICSNDGQIFCVHSYFLRASSCVFRELLDGLPPKPEGFTHEPITIDATSSILSSFLHLIIGEDRSTSRPLRDVIALIRLLNIYKCSIAHERLVLRLHRNLAPASDKLWTIFVLASHLQDVLLAKKALGLMSPVHHAWLVDGGWTAERVGEVTKDYLAGLVNAVLKIKIVMAGKQVKDGRGEVDWVKLAEDFNPVK
ncbi:hypothetical protein BCR39DRAFT_517770 [Naematelia encephala]|uniref:BTB domain-containing protein n=1 Tax=Naematelia encephala TaxID=71784 RepID=A0A1Y2BHR6_9TREE|nr:hypothetical protein BCR39DRAFT_517770 [Naematelia encephala]